MEGWAKMIGGGGVQKTYNAIEPDRMQIGDPKNLGYDRITG